MPADDLLRTAYAAYNRQDLDPLLAMVSDDVDWPDSAGGRLNGRAALREYWREQWTRTRTHDEPVAITHRGDGRVVARIDQVVRSLDGQVVSAGAFDHIHLVAGGLLRRLDIEPV